MTDQAEYTAEKTLYVHLANDGRIYLLPGWNPLGQWVDRAALDSALAKCKEIGGLILYSRQNAAADPSPTAFATFEHMVEFKLPFRLLTEPHPEVVAAGAA